MTVSTHSRPKAAGHCVSFVRAFVAVFQHTAARRRLVFNINHLSSLQVSTHSRPKAAGVRRIVFCHWRLFQHTAARRRLAIMPTCANASSSFNTQPPEGGWIVCTVSCKFFRVSTHSRPKAAGITMRLSLLTILVSTHSRPKAAVFPLNTLPCTFRFQHTAARRRLEAIPARY